MKKVIIVFLACIAHAYSFSQKDATGDSTGLAGDNFSLQGALELFSKATSIEEFEKALNTASNHVNNLDLNEDAEIDYVRVEDHTDGNVHAFALQVGVSETESQDVAVIEIEKTGETVAQAQIVGDEELYGEGIYVEALDEKAKGGKGGPSAPIETYIIVVNVWLWPCVQFIYAPSYLLWNSPWHWRAHPSWWKPWRPYGWRVHYGYSSYYLLHFHSVQMHRCNMAHVVYRAHRKHSVTVHSRYKEAHIKHKAQKAMKPNTSNKGKGKDEKSNKGNKAKKPQEHGKQEIKRDKDTKPTKTQGAEKSTKKNTKSGGAKPAKAGGKGGKK